MEQNVWYQMLIRPSYAPPAWLFGPVWTVLYIGIAVSFGWVLVQLGKGNISWWIALPFILNLIFNLAFSPIQFGLQNLQLATVDIFLVLGTLIWALVVIYPIAAWVVWVNIPYTLWVAFAAVLQTHITVLNT